MLNSKTVFILGAGASSEVGFPLGSKLKIDISNKLNININSISVQRGDNKIFKHLISKYQVRQTEMIDVCNKISKGIVWSASIDDFIDDHKHDERIATFGKLAIAYSILDAERDSKIFFEPRDKETTIKYDGIKDTWYPKFYSLLKKQIARNNLDNIFNNVTVINFNYDRSLEHFLTNAISNNYIIGIEEARSIVNKLVIYRPYGTIDHSVGFGSGETLNFENIISNLKTYTEQIEDTDGLEQVQLAIRDSNVVVFLGMAYHPNNMKLLEANCKTVNKVIYATRAGFISDEDINIVKRRIITSLKPDILDSTYVNTFKRIQSNMFLAETCTELFENYKLALSEH
jgi:hypothetical protein